MATSFTDNNSDSSSRRVRLRPLPNAVNTIYGNGLIAPLRNTNGMVWMYQPIISYQQGTTYTSIDLVHANTELYAYTRTNALRFTVDGKFSVQNQTEGVYALACIHFLRTVTKMWFGQNDTNAGTPPPILYFDAYGDYMFNKLPVIVNEFTIGLPDDVDYVPISQSYLSTQGTTDSKGNANNTLGSTPLTAQTIPTTTNTNALSNTNLSGNNVWLPAVFNISVTMTVQQTPSNLRSVFNLDQFRSGQLMKQGGWI